MFVKGGRGAKFPKGGPYFLGNLARGGPYFGGAKFPGTPAIKTIHERCENKRVKTMCNTEICYFIYKLSLSSFVKYEYMQLQNK